MPSKAQKRRTAQKQQYAENKNVIKEKRKIRYDKNCENEKFYAREYHKNNSKHRSSHSRKVYDNDTEGRKKEASRVASRISYQNNPDKKKEASRVASRVSYKQNPDKKKEISHKYYNRKCYIIKQKAKAKYYKIHSQKRFEALLYYKKNKRFISAKRKQQRILKSKFTGSKKLEILNILKKTIRRNQILREKCRNKLPAVHIVASKKMKQCRNSKVISSCKGRAFHKGKHKYVNSPIVANRKKQCKKFKVTKKRAFCKRFKSKHTLKKPSVTEKFSILTKLKKRIHHTCVLKCKLKRLHAKSNVDLMKRQKSLNKAIANYVSTYVLNKSLNLRSENVKKYLKSIQDICKFDLGGALKERSHSKNTEPYFYETAYLDSSRQFLNHFVYMCRIECDVNDTSNVQQETYIRKKPMPIDKFGRCILADVQETEDNRPKRWCCTSACKQLTKEEYDIILDTKNKFSDDSVQNVRNMLLCIDECPNNKHPKIDVYNTNVEKMGHSMLCTDGSCKSPLRLLRQACTHHTHLSPLLRSIYSARLSSAFIRDIDTAMNNGDIEGLMKLGKCEDVFEEPFEADNVTGSGIKSKLLHNEKDIQRQYMVAIDNYQSKATDDHEFACLCCERLCNKQYCTGPFSLNKEKYDTPIYRALKVHIRKIDPDADCKVYYVCKYCQPLLLRDKMPNRCVLNGLETDPVPKELSNLSPFCKQMIQKVKPFQTVVRLGTYMRKVPKYNTLKACKGTMFFLPLPLDNTKRVLEEALASSTLPDPEVFIIVNGKPTKSKVIWQELINIEGVKKALAKLTEINWLYHNVDKDSIDDALKKIMESTSNLSNKMLEKATKVDIDAFQSYTVRCIDEKQTTGTDIDQYKLLNVRDDPVDNRQKYLDVMCFPSLFPTGNFGAYHDRNVPISQAEYAKSRLLNKDSHFRKDSQYVFYLYWQKELRELNSGIYNLLKNTGKTEMCVSELLRQVDSSDQQLEINLSTVLQSIRGTRQFWNVKRGELNCMCREYGPPTLFMTFSCAEYDSEDIERYLRKVNDVPASYSHSKLCVEDPISVSRKFSQQFHALFNEVLLKGQVLGKITHFFWKKEYQARGAPHYHMVVWIDGAPIVGVDDPDIVTSFIDDRITCKLPNKDDNPTLHKLVTKYNTHVCNNYCRRVKKVNGTFIVKCRFLFPHPVSDTTQLYNVDECLKSKKTLYSLARTSEETRINAYNPLLMLLWKANVNMDIQYIGESSGALCNYISGYITKAEKSHMQETWEEITSNKSIYSRLFSFGVRSLRSRECGLYEASDILLGDHLYSKSAEVQWVNVNQSEKRKRRIKKYTELKNIAKSNPDSTSIFEANLIDDHYPNRPSGLENVCLHDYVSGYKRVKSMGVTKTVPRNKHILVNHFVYNPAKEEQKDNYYYSLLVLFVPFRNESDLISEGHTPEMAFNSHVASNVAMKEYHNKLTKALQCQQKIQDINEARAKDTT